MFWLWIFCGGLTLIIIALLIKIALLHKVIDEIHTEFQSKLDTDTNTLITVSSRDRHVRRLAAELNTQLRFLRTERRRYQSGDLNLKEAVTNISHDLRTPLTSIWGYLELLKREEKSEEVKRYLDIIENRTEVLRQFSEELFRYSIAASETGELNYDSISINSVLEESIFAHYAALKHSSITPKITIPEQNIQRELDGRALSRILGNIISNAIKYSDGDLEIVLTGTGEMIFSNHASKLDAIQTGKLFDRYYTVEDANKSTGLGLSIAKTLTEEMNGTISAEYEEGKLKIYLTFP